MIGAVEKLPVTDGFAVRLCFLAVCECESFRHDSNVSQMPTEGGSWVIRYSSLQGTGRTESSPRCSREYSAMVSPRLWSKSSSCVNVRIPSGMALPSLGGAVGSVLHQTAVKCT